MSAAPALKRDTAVIEHIPEDILPEPRNPDPVTTEAEIVRTARRVGTSAALATQTPGIATSVATHATAMYTLSQLPSSGYWPASYFASVSAYQGASVLYSTTAGTIAAQAAVGFTALVLVTATVAIAKTAYNNYHAPSVEGRASWWGVGSRLVSWGG